MTDETLADIVRRDDPERHLAALFAPGPVRSGLFALYAFNIEIARVSETVSEPVIGEMRLAWARDAIVDLYADPPRVRRHPVYEALAALRSLPGAPDLDSLGTLVEARAADLGQGAFPDDHERERYVDRTAGLLMRLAARLCLPGADDDVAVNGAAVKGAVQAAGRLWGYTGLLRAFAPLCAAGRPPVTDAELAASGANVEALRRGLQPDAAANLRHGLAGVAHAAASEFEKTRHALPPELFPAIGYVTLAKPLLRRAARQDWPGQATAMPLLECQARLIVASLRGRP